VSQEEEKRRKGEKEIAELLFSFLFSSSPLLLFSLYTLPDGRVSALFVFNA
jgi:hypothetical protein